MRAIVDGIMVFGDEKIFDIRDEFLLTEEQKKKWHHIWYIPKKDVSLPEIKERNAKKILVSSWGNITSKDDFLSLLEFLVGKDEYDIEILVWPYVDEYISREIDYIVRGKTHMKISAFKKNFATVLHASDYFFGFGGYGTFQDLFHYQGRAYIMANYNLSNFRHRYYEQKYRAKLFESILNIEFLEDFSEKHLEKCVDSYIPKETDTSQIRFCDTDILKKTVSDIYNQD